jgi:hypothetical protein
MDADILREIYSNSKGGKKPKKLRAKKAMGLSPAKMRKLKLASGMYHPSGSGSNYVKLKPGYRKTDFDDWLTQASMLEGGYVDDPHEIQGGYVDDPPEIQGGYFQLAGGRKMKAKKGKAKAGGVLGGRKMRTSNPWIQLVKKVQKETGLSYKDSLKHASKLYRK